jgi:hypothetical protein
MKRLKKLTRRQQKNAEKLFGLLSENIKSTPENGKQKRKRKLHLSLKSFLANAVDQITITARTVEPIFSVKEYFAKKAKARLEKLTQREENRQAKADKIAVRAKLKEAKRLVREAKEAKRAARLAKKQELETK